MTTSEIEIEVRQAMAHIACVDENEITPQAQLAGDLQFDSLDLAELAIELEEKFFGGEPVVTDEYVSEWKTVIDVIGTIEKLQLRSAKKGARR